MNSKRVLLVHRFFAPDVTTYAQMLGVFGEHLVDQGHEVTIATGPPSYNNAYTGPDVARRERVNGMDVRRFRVPGANSKFGKIAGSALFPIAVLGHILSRRKAYDVVSVTTIPPVVMGLTSIAGRLRSRRTRVVYHCMDLYPEAALALGLIKDGPVAKVARWLDRQTVNNAGQVIVLSNEMKSTLERRGIDANVGVCNNFILKDRDDAASGVEIPEIDKTWLIFAGNLGRFQGLEPLVEAIEIVAAERDDFEVVFLGAGALSDWLVSQEKDGLPIRVLPFRPLPEAMAIIEQAHGAIVSLSPGVSQAAFPSKLLMNLELGRPIFGIVEPESDLAQMIQDHDLGVSADPRKPDEIAEALGLFLDNTAGWDSSKIRAVGQELFGRDNVLTNWTRLYGLSE